MQTEIRLVMMESSNIGDSHQRMGYSRGSKAMQAEMI